jgi:hypothetical protein
MKLVRVDSTNSSNGPFSQLEVSSKYFEPSIKRLKLTSFRDNDWMNQEGAKRLAKDFENIELHTI